METKKCSYCKIDKPLSKFNKDNVRNGLQRLCRDCNKLRNRYHKEKKAELEGRTLQYYREKQYANLTDEELLEHLRRFNLENGRPPSSIDLDGNPNYPHAYTYYRRFKYKSKKDKAAGWNEIIKLAGLNPLDYNKIWSAWQYLVEISAEALRGECIFQATGIAKGYRPDIMLKNEKVIIDAATSNYDSKHKVKQFNSAKSAGYKVEYWCLYKTTENGINETELKYVFSDEIIQRLKGIGEYDLADDILNLLQKHDIYAERILEHRKEYIRKKLNELFVLLGRVPQTRDLLGRHGFPSATSIAKVFGSFNNALNFAELQITREKIEPHEERIAIDELLEFTKKLGRIPKVREIGPPNTTYTEKVYFKFYGGIEKCLQNQGINTELLKKQEKEKEIEIRLKQVISFYTKNGRYPKQAEFRIENNLPSYHWIHDHFKNMNNLKKEAELYLQSGRGHTV